MKRLMSSLACIGLLALGLTEPAFALSCDFRDRVERTFALHHAQAERYIVGHGILVPDEPVPVFNQDTQLLEPDRIGARFEGRLASPRGFTGSTAFKVSVSIKCMVDACGVVPEERPALMFIRDDGGNYSVTTDYCSGGILSDPTEEEMMHLLDCLRGNACDAP